MLWIWAPHGAAMLLYSLLKKGRTRLAHSIFSTLATHTGLVQDITHTDCWAQNGTTHSHVFTTFSCWFSAKRTQNRVKNSSKTIIYSIPSAQVRDASSLWFSFNYSAFSFIYIYICTNNIQNTQAHTCIYVHTNITFCFVHCVMLAN